MTPDHPSSTGGSPPPSADMPPPSTTTEPPASATPNPQPPPETGAAAAAAPPFTVTCTAGVAALGLVLRLLTFVFLLISLVITATNTVRYINGLGFEAEIKFDTFYAYRYMLSTIVFGITYTLLQTALSIFRVNTGGNRLGAANLLYLDFYGDKVISYMLGTGAAAGFGITVDLNRIPFDDADISGFLNKANAAASLLFFGFLFSAISSVLSSLALPKRI